MADANNTATSHADFVPEVWATEALLAFTDHTENGLLQVVSDVSSMLPEGGDKINVGKQIAISMGAVTDGTALEYTQWSSSAKTLSVSTEKGVVPSITYRLHAQSNTDLFNAFARQIGASSAKNVDASLAALYSSAGETVTGTTGADISEANIRAAKKQLDEANCPRPGRWLVVNPQQLDAMSAIARFSELDKIGSGASIVEGMVGRVHGFNVFSTTNVVETTDGFAHCLAGITTPGDPLMSSIQLAAGRYRAPMSNVTFSDVPSIGLRMTIDNDNKLGGESLRGSQLYGVATWRDEWLVDIKVAN